MTFVIIALLMLVAAVAAIAWPLVRLPDPVRSASREALRQHNNALKALEKQLKRGELDTTAYLDARKRLEESLQNALTEAQAAGKPVPRRPALATAVTASVLVPVIAIGMYVLVGNWRVAIGNEQLAAQRSVNEMVADLARRLNTTDSGDAEGWIMLGRSYVVMGRYADAVPAYAHAVSLLGDGNANLLVDYAEAMILANPDQLTQQAAPLLEKALRAAPDNPKALWYGGLLALKQQNRKLAIARWQEILKQNPSAGIKQLIEQHIREAGGSVADVSSTQASDKIDIPVHITLGRQLAKKIPSNAILFVFVRPTDNSAGPPLLAERVPVSAMPIDLKLTDADAMMPGTSLAGYRQVEVMARVSLSGNAVAQPGDMEGKTVIKLASKPAVANIAISQVVQ